MATLAQHVAVVLEDGDFFKVAEDMQAAREYIWELVENMAPPQGHELHGSFTDGHVFVYQDIAGTSNRISTFTIIWHSVYHREGLTPA